MSTVTLEEDLAAETKAAAKPTPFYRKLYVQVIFAIVVGAIIGLLNPHFGVALNAGAVAFIKAIKVVVIPVIFVTIVTGIAKMGNLRRVANVGAKSLIYFEIISTLALIIGMVVGNVWKVGAGMNANPNTLNTAAIAGYAKSAHNLTLQGFFLNMIPHTFIDPFARGDIIQIVFLALLLGVALSLCGERAKPLVSLFDAMTDALFEMVRIIMYFAPIGALCAMAFTVGKYGVSTLLSLGELVASVYVVTIAFVIIVLGTALRLCGFSIWKVIGYFKDELIFVFAATAGETMMPRSMQKLEKIGVSKEVVGLVMPAGFTFNMDGTAIYMTMAVLFLAHAFNVHLTIWHQLAVLFIMLFTSKGAAGVTGGGFIALAATLPVVDAVPIAGLAMLFGVDRFMAQVRAVSNLFSNIIATLVIGRWTESIDMEQAKSELDGQATLAPAE